MFPLYDLGDGVYACGVLNIAPEQNVLAKLSEMVELIVYPLTWVNFDA